MPELDHKVVEDVYKAVLSDFKKAAQAQGRGVDDAEEVATEAITRMLEAHQKNPIENPLHWTRHAAANLWRDIGRTDRKHVSYEGVVGMSRDVGAWTTSDSDGVREGIEVLAHVPEHDRDKRLVPGRIRDQMSEAVTEPRSPELIAEQRDLLQKIDPDWREHMEEGYDFRSGKKLDRNTRRQIQRRARRLLNDEEEPLC